MSGINLEPDAEKEEESVFVLRPRYRGWGTIYVLFMGASKSKFITELGGEEKVRRNHSQVCSEDTHPYFTRLCDCDLSLTFVRFLYLLWIVFLLDFLTSVCVWL